MYMYVWQVTVINVHDGQTYSLVGNGYKCIFVYMMDVHDLCLVACIYLDTYLILRIHFHVSTTLYNQMISFTIQQSTHYCSSTVGQSSTTASPYFIYINRVHQSDIWGNFFRNTEKYFSESCSEGHTNLFVFKLVHPIFLNLFIQSWARFSPRLGEQIKEKLIQYEIR